MGAPPTDQHSQPTPDQMPFLPKTPHAPPGDTEGAQGFHINNFPPGYVYLHFPFSSAQYFNLDGYSPDSQDDTDYNPDILTDEGTSTG
jgi:hypothetical protein